MSRDNGQFGGRVLSCIVSAAALFVALGACSGSTESTKPISREDFAQAFASAACDNIGSCCVSEGYPFDRTACYAGLERQLGKFIAEANLEGVIYDAEAAGKCAADYARVARNCSDPYAIEESCSKVLRGSKMSGEACTTSSQCASRSCGPQSGSGELRCDSTQIDEVHGTEGQPCGGTCTAYDERSLACGGKPAPPGTTPSRINCYTNDGLFCSPDFVCAKVPALGEACTLQSPCTTDAFCEGGTCVPKRTSGSCANSFDACASTAYCDLDTHECKAKKRAGDACTSGLECPSPTLCRGPATPSMPTTCRLPTAANEEICIGN